MKKSLQVLVFCSLCITFAQAQPVIPIPNGGFENWTKNPPVVGLENPDGWATTNELRDLIRTADPLFNDPGFPNVYKNATYKHSGQYSMYLKAIKLASNPAPGDIPDTIIGAAITGTSFFTALGNVAGFPVAAAPGKMRGFYAYLPGSANDSAILLSVATKYNTAMQKQDTLGIGFLKLPGTGTPIVLQSFTMPMTYFAIGKPDSCKILISCSDFEVPIPNSQLVVDDIEYLQTPIALYDIDSTIENTPKLIAVKANDHIPSGNIVMTVTTPPASGLAEVAGNNIRYTPNPGYSGVETFYYTICDDFGNCDQAIVYVLVKPGTVSVANVKGLQPVSVYPNPTAELLNISTGSIAAKSIQVMDLSTRSVKSYTLKDNADTAINVSTFKTGAYFYNLLDAQGRVVFSGKFQVAH